MKYDFGVMEVILIDIGIGVILIDIDIGVMLIDIPTL